MRWREFGRDQLLALSRSARQMNLDVANHHTADTHRCTTYALKGTSRLCRNCIGMTSQLALFRAVDEILAISVCFL